MQEHRIFGHYVDADSRLAYITGTAMALQTVRGIGGIFFRSRDPQALAAWYRDQLGVPVTAGQTYATFGGDGDTGPTVWSSFPSDTDYFGPSGQAFMINFRVDDLDAMLKQLREAGADVEDRVEDYEYGRFGWASDPDGNRFELWEPANMQE